MSVRHSVAICGDGKIKQATFFTDRMDEIFSPKKKQILMRSTWSISPISEAYFAARTAILDIHSN